MEPWSVPAYVTGCVPYANAAPWKGPGGPCAETEELLLPGFPVQHPFAGVGERVNILSQMSGAAQQAEGV